MASKSLTKIEAAPIAERGNVQLDALRRIAEQRTPEEEIRWRAGRGGARLPYTDGAYVARTLNEAFNFDWDFEADNEEMILNPLDGRPFEVKVRGRLTIRLGGQAVTKTQFGCQPIEYLKEGRAPVSIGDCYKGAATDALKKCASLLGVALDLYDSDSPIHTSGSNGDGNQSGNQARGGGKQAGNRRPSILAFAEDALKWTPEQLIAEIHQRFGIAIEPANLVSALESLPAMQLKELDQSLKTELWGRAK